MQKIKSQYVIAFLVVFYLAGIAGLSWNRSSALFTMLIPYSILLSSGLLLIYHTPKKRSQLWVFSVIFITGFAIEAVGVKTGRIFGEYHYSDILGWKIAETPILMGLNWLMVIYMAWMIVKRLKIHGWIKVLAASGLLVAYDLVLEPFAINYDLWTWDTTQPPLQNFIGWFLISVAFFAFISKSKVEMKNPVASYMFVIQFLFFCILFLINTF